MKVYACDGLSQTWRVHSKVEGDAVLFFYTFLKNLAHSISTCPSFIKYILAGHY